MKKYEQLYRRIKEQIQTGVLSEGERLPSLRETSRDSSLSLNTVLTAYEYLTDEGLIRARERGGYFVCSGATDLTREQSAPAPLHSSHSTSREAGERLDQLYERLLLIDPSFASAAPAADILPGAELNRIASGLTSTWLAHSDTRGDYALRKRLALVNRDWDGPCEPEDLVITNGATEALSLILQTLLRPGDTIALESPVYFNFFRQLSSFGVNIVEIPLNSEGMDLNILEDEIRKQPIRMILTQPNVQNPTGITMAESTRKGLLALAEKNGIFLVQDDVFGDISFAPIRPGNLSSLSDYPRLLQISSYSKSLAPGLRIGWIRSALYAKELSEAKLRLSMESSRLAQAVLTGYIGTKSHRRHLQQIRQTLSARVDDHLSRLAEVIPPDSFVRRPSGGCLLWIEFPRRIDTDSLFERAAGQGLIATPGTMFSAGNRYSNCLRLNTGHKLTEERARVLGLLKE
ncbi:MAG: PLP-dependent aminotransferase family protein [Spirochaetales bacterium]|nr:PLP-dependent aminotransferase family protein [Spirochaetales bacterium]